jgi:hypothetical protein
MTVRCYLPSGLATRVAGLNAVIAVMLMPWMVSNLLILRAGDGDRTRDVQLGKLDIN